MELHPVPYLFQAVNFLGVEESCQVKGHERQSPLLILCNRAKFPPNTVPMGPNHLPEESPPQKKSCVTPLPTASGRAASSSLCGSTGPRGIGQALANSFYADHSTEITSKN